MTYKKAKTQIQNDESWRNQFQPNSLSLGSSAERHLDFETCHSQFLYEASISCLINLLRYTCRYTPIFSTQAPGSMKRNKRTIYSLEDNYRYKLYVINNYSIDIPLVKRLIDEDHWSIVRKPAVLGDLDLELYIKQHMGGSRPWQTWLKIRSDFPHFEMPQMFLNRFLKYLY